jgi:formylmethanofuran dehydrogenase subunit E
VGSLSRYGRRTQFLLILAAVAVIAGAAIWIVSRLSATGPEQAKPPIYLVCTECGAVYQARHRLGGDQPRTCEQCGKRAAWFAMRCNDCGAVFPLAPPLDAGGHVIQEMPTCPACHGSNYSYYEPDTSRP